MIKESVKPISAFSAFAKKIGSIFEQESSSKTYYDSQTLINGYNPNNFMQIRGFRTIDKMLTDDTIFGILEMKKVFLLSAGYEFQYTEQAEGKNYKKILDFVNYNFGDGYPTTFIRDVYSILSAGEYGFSLSEMIFTKKDKSKYKNMIWLDRLKPVPPHSVNFFTDDYGNLNKITQKGTKLSNLSEELPIWKFLLYTKNCKFDNPYGISDLERCYPAWMIKNMVYKLWGIYLQRFASAFPFAKVPADYGENNSTELLKILESIQQSGAAVVPETVDLTFLESAKSGSEYDSAIEKLNQTISRSLLVPDLLGFGKSISGGSFALGKKHFDLFIQLIDSDRKQIEDIINDRVIKTLVDFNFGTQEIYPKMIFNAYGDDEYQKMLSLFLEATKTGMPVSLEDYDHFREKIGFPLLNKDKIMKTQEEPTQKADVKKEDKEEDNEDNEDNEKLDDKEKKDIQDVKEEFAKSDFKINRKPSKYEARIDFVSEAKEIYNKGDEAINDLAKIFKKIKISLKDTIIRRKIIENNLFNEIDRLQLKYIGEVKDTLNSSLIDLYNFSWKKATNEIKTLKKAQAKRTENFIDSPNDLLVPSEEAQNIADSIINQQTFQTVGNLRDELLNDSKATLLNGMQRGESTQKIISSLDTIFNKVTEGVAAVDLTPSPYLLENIIRTNFNNFYNLARKQAANTPNLGSFIWGYEYSAILDDRTTERCSISDRTIAAKDDPIWNSLTPPLHYQCRSQLRYITEIDVEADGVEPTKKPSLEKLKNMPGGDFI